MWTARVDADCQVTIPREIQEAMGIQLGNRLEFVQETSACVYIMPFVIDGREVSGISYSEERQAFSLTEIEEAIAEKVCSSQ